MKAWLGLGSNLQQPVGQLKDALSRLDLNEGFEVLKTSSLYRTPPWGDEHQDDFVNAVVQLETNLDAIALLHQLQSIENMINLDGGVDAWAREVDPDMPVY